VEEAQVEPRELVAAEEARRSEPRFDGLESREEPRHRRIIRLLAPRKPAAVHAVVDVRVHDGFVERAQLGVLRFGVEIEADVVGVQWREVIV
jgi:hypothetical protein